LKPDRPGENQYQSFAYRLGQSREATPIVSIPKRNIALSFPSGATVYPNDGGDMASPATSFLRPIFLKYFKKLL
jgi:hypothetical protein